ncbi:hypothetical protein MPL3365_60100 [Mesorhizobium plurifarium]|uniref:Uncharacterized protein n=1 Tax=Mesorhizobium plurifarium TaxID=69974 RepID=A0A090GBF2_MESPL|nr:hypothetical protein MPL3365_60100 [Mesorhizobium plurifarium]
MFLVLGAWNLSSMTGLQAFQALDCLRAWLSRASIGSFRFSVKPDRRRSVSGRIHYFERCSRSHHSTS